MQSKRVQLERAVIQAARDMAAAAPIDAGRLSNVVLLRADRLISAIEALDALEPAAIVPTEGAVNSNAPDTAKSAALQAVPITGLVRREILDEIWPLHDSDSKGLTCDELESRIRRPHTTVSSQVNWLSNNGWIEDSNFRRKTRSGRDAIVWVLTPNARALMSGS